MGLIDKNVNIIKMIKMKRNYDKNANINRQITSKYKSPNNISLLSIYYLNLLMNLSFHLLINYFNLLFIQNISLSYFHHLSVFIILSSISIY